MHSDPIADYLTRIRNALMARKQHTVCPHSNLKEEISKLLKSEGYIVDYKVSKNDKNFKELELELDPSKKINLKRVSRPGQPMYSKAKALPRVLNGYGIAIISTPKGLMTDKEARKQNLGGEIMCEIY